MPELKLASDTKLLAPDSNATKRPSAFKLGCDEEESAGVPSFDVLARKMSGTVQDDASQSPFSQVLVIVPGPSRQGSLLVSSSTHSSWSSHCAVCTHVLSSEHTSTNVPRPFRPQAVLPKRSLPSSHGPFVPVPPTAHVPP